jgi:hypothetical protein
MLVALGSGRQQQKNKTSYKINCEEIILFSSYLPPPQLRECLNILNPQTGTWVTTLNMHSYKFHMTKFSRKRFFYST